MKLNYHKIFFAGAACLAVSLAALGILMFLGLISNVISLRRQAQADSLTLKLEDSSALNPQETSEEQAGGKVSFAELGTRAANVSGEDGFKWPDDQKLFLDGLKFFEQRKNWRACIYLATLPAAKSLTDENRFKYPEAYYRETIGAGLDSEITKLKKAYPELKLPENIPGDLPLPLGFTMIAGLKNYLQKNMVPTQVADILLEALIYGSGDTFFRAVAMGIVRDENIAVPDYQDADEFTRSLFLKNLTYSDLYLKKIFSDSWEETSKTKWMRTMIVHSYPDSKSRNYLKKCLLDKEKTFNRGQYQKLSRFHRWIIANQAISGVETKPSGPPDKEAFKYLLRGSVYWNSLFDDSIADNKVVSELRQDPRYLKLLEKQKSSRALQYLKADYFAMTGYAMSADLERRFRKMLELEQNLWKELVNKEKWQRLFEQENRRKGAKPWQVFKLALKRLMPVRKRTDWQSLLIAVVVINRGGDGRYIDVELKLKKSFLEDHLPEEEMNELR
jgi:hypothetical protein